MEVFMFYHIQGENKDLTTNHSNKKNGIEIKKIRKQKVKNVKTEAEIIKMEINPNTSYNKKKVLRPPFLLNT